MTSVSPTAALLFTSVQSSMRPRNAGKRILLMRGTTPMDDLDRKALTGVAKFQAVLAAIVFASAWALTYWQGWVYRALFSASVIAITIYFLRRDRALVQRRMKAGPAAERLPTQKRPFNWSPASLAAQCSSCPRSITGSAGHRWHGPRSRPAMC
jgi:hypothetical protein